jgi:hypothetical protein
MIVRLKQKSAEYSDLTPAQPYFVIGIEADDYRILNDSGKPYLYSSELFEIVDPYEPDEWIIEYGDEGERYSYPLLLNRAGFFEDYFDGDTKSVSIFWHVVNRRLANVA